MKITKIRIENYRSSKEMAGDTSRIPKIQIKILKG